MSKSKLSQEEINQSVADFYRKIAQNEESTQIDANQLNKSIGYKQEEIDSVPEEANMGLGCGNPQEKAQPQNGEVVIDLGCGKGFDAFIASKKVGAAGSVIGVDMTAEMINKARKIAQKRQFNNIDFRLGEIENLPVADNTADLVISNCVINLSTRKQDVYNEIFRVLKPGGRIGISDITLHETLPDSVYNNPKMYGTWVAGAETLEELRKIIQQAGFTDIDIEASEVTNEYAAKWGINEVDLKYFLRTSIITAYKPLKV